MQKENEDSGRFIGETPVEEMGGYIGTDRGPLIDPQAREEMYRELRRSEGFMGQKTESSRSLPWYHDLLVSIRLVTKSLYQLLILVWSLCLAVAMPRQGTNSEPREPQIGSFHRFRGSMNSEKTARELLEEGRAEDEDRENRLSRVARGKDKT